MRVRNISPLGHLDVPLIGREGPTLGKAGRGCLEPGEDIEVTADQARILLCQGDVFEPADEEAAALLAEAGPDPAVVEVLTALTITELRAIATQAGLDPAGMKKADIVALLGKELDQ